MIANDTIRNCTFPFPAVEGLIDDNVLGKIKIKNIYQSWRGESIQTIKRAHADNPYSLRIGMPSTDNQLKNDAVFLILNYLSYNPLTRDIEKRELVPYRNMDKIYIGQSIDEKRHYDYRLFVDGEAIMDELYLKRHEKIWAEPVGELLISLMDKVEKLQVEVGDLRRQLKSKHIYTQGINNEQINTVPSRKHID